MKFNNIQNLKRQEGITIIALVVTIIILIILAGVSINLLLGENGLIEIARGTKEKQTITEITERLELEKANMVTENGNSIQLNDYLEEIQKENVIIGHVVKLESKDKAETNAYIIVDDKYEYLLEKEENGNIKITYNGKSVLVESIELDKTELTIEMNTTQELKVNLLPEKASNKNIRWETSNPEVAIVENGIVTPIEQGECTITATAIHGINKTATCNIKVIYATLASKVNPGDYVLYTPINQSYTVSTSQTGYSSNQTFNTGDSTNLWQILYNDDTYGLQITSSKSVATLGLGVSGNINSARAGYNNIITTLNNISSNYINTAYATSARSIGSNPLDPADRITGYFTVPSSWTSGGYTGFKTRDSYYTTDSTAMKNATSKNASGISIIDREYYMASREVGWDPNDHAIFYVRTMNTAGNVVASTGRIAACSDGGGLASVWMTTCTSGVRPVVSLIRDISIIGGNGTQEEPYILKPVV